jgi:hypothetical protein
MQNRILLSFDWAVKRLPRNKANYVILESFLSELLKRTIKIKQLLDSESNKEHSFGKLITQWGCLKSNLGAVFCSKNRLFICS